MTEQTNEMKTYQIEIQETLSKIITVEAASSGEAIAQASKEYYEGEHELGSQHFMDADFILDDSDIPEVRVPEVEEEMRKNGHL